MTNNILKPIGRIQAKFFRDKRLLFLDSFGKDGEWLGYLFAVAEQWSNTSKIFYNVFISKTRFPEILQIPRTIKETRVGTINRVRFIRAIYRNGL